MSRAAILVVLLAACSGSDGGPDTLPDVPAETVEDVAPDVPPGPAPLEVSTAQGPVRGASSGEQARVFLGIPYAAPPVGPLRFLPPQPAPSRTGTLDATAFGPACYQAPSFTVEAPYYDEDCLTLNVWAPALRTPVPAPVLVFVHGGGYVQGGAASSTLDGTALAARGVVVVTMNYRLGPFGFLAHPELPQSGNVGIRDQRAALAWVRDNIAAFGGDPARVTLAGQSAGGMSVCIHAASPGSQGLFHALVMESGPCFEGLPPRPVAEAQGLALAKAVGCEGEGATTCLQQAPSQEILDALPPRQGIFFGEGAFWLPHVDQDVLAKQPYEAVRDDLPATVPVLLGANGDEGTLLRFLAFGAGSLSEEDWEAFVRKVFVGDADRILAEYPASEYPSARAAADALLGDFVFTCPTRRTAAMLRDADHPTYLYRFLHAPGLMPIPDAGSFHTAELPFVFASLPSDPTPQPGQADLAQAMVAAWAAFAGTGTTGPDWPATDDALTHRVWDVPPGTTATGFTDERCAFWDTILARP